MEFIVLLGRIILSGFFLVSGFNHFKHKEQMSAYAGMFGVSSSLVLFSGALLFLGGLGILLGVYPMVSITVLIVTLLAITFKMHAFWNKADQDKQMDLIQFKKNLALIGALLLMYGLALPWEYALNVGV